MKLHVGRRQRIAAAALVLLASACGCKPTGEAVPPSALQTQVAAPAAASEAPGYASTGSITVTDAWARATPPGSASAAAYFTLTNRGAEEDTLVSLSSPAAASAELHESTLETGVARMRPVGPQVITGGGVLSASPGGIHVMLSALKQPLVEGQRVPLTLQLRNAGKLTVQVTVRPLVDATAHPVPEHAGH